MTAYDTPAVAMLGSDATKLFVDSLEIRGSRLGHVLAALVRRLAAALAAAGGRSRHRHSLATMWGLDDHILRDIGVSRDGLAAMITEMEERR